MYNYEKLMEQEELKLSELPDDARIGIETIATINRVIVLNESKGRKIRPDVHKKIAANDKWVTREILDYVEGRDSNQSDVAPHAAKDVIKDIEQDAVDPKGVAIDVELKALIEANMSVIKLDELKSKAPQSYAVIFQHYDESGDNGIETSFYSIHETDTETFTIKAK